LDIPSSKFKVLDDPRLKGVTAYRIRAEVYGREWTLVVTRSEELLQGQMRGIQQHLAKKVKALAELQVRVRRQQEGRRRGGRPYTREALQKQADKLAQGQYLREVLRVQVEATNGKLRLTYRTDRGALARLKRRELGKRILFTDNHEWSTEDIVLGYRNQHHVEAAFRQMKDPHFVSWSPMFHWTDSRIRVHAFYCVLALTLAALLQRRAAQAGIRLTADDIIDQLAGIEEIHNLYPPTGGGAGRPRAEVTSSRRNRVQDRLWRALNLEPLAAV
jgi:transposase